MAANQQLHVDVRSEEGSLWATVAELPRVFAAGDDLDELRESLQGGIALMLEGRGGDAPAVRTAPFEPSSSQVTANAELVLA